MAANRAPFVLQGVPILSCDRCQFFCSDERYLMAHMSVEHDDNEKSVPKVAPGEVDDAVKQAIKSPPRRREIESAIESTSKTLSYLYAALLADPSEGPSPLLTRAQPHTTPLQLSPTALGTTPSTMISPKVQLNNVQAGLPGPATSPLEASLHTSQAQSASQSRPGSARKRRRSENESLPAFRPTAFGQMGNLPLPASSNTQSTSNPSLNILNLLQISKMSNELEKRNALIETIKRARMANHAFKIDDAEEEIVVEPSEPKEEKDSKASDDEEIIEIPTEEPPSLSQELNLAQTLQNRMNPLNLFQHQNLPKNSLAFPSSDSLVSRSKSSNVFPNFALQNSLLKFHESQQRDKKKSVSPVGLDRNANSGLSLVGYHGASNGGTAVSTSGSSTALVPKNPILCNICGSSWRTPSALNIHMRVHTGEKPYKCMICGKGHKQKGQLKVHINKHHPGQWPAVGNMLNQMIKDPKKCSMCGECFTEPKELSKHILECAPTGLSIPPGQPRPSCDICGISFSSTLNFKRHMDSHRLEKGQSNAPSEVSDISESNSESKSSAIQLPPGVPIHSPELMQKFKHQYEFMPLPGARKTWRNPSNLFYKSPSQAAGLSTTMIPNMFTSASLLGQSSATAQPRTISPACSPPSSTANRESPTISAVGARESSTSPVGGIKECSSVSHSAANLARSNGSSSPLITVASTHSHASQSSSSPSPHQISGFSVADQAKQATAIATE